MRSSRWLALLSLSLFACSSPTPAPDAATDGGMDGGGPLIDVIARPDSGVCEDLDDDGHRSAACGGDDCDDNNARRFPGNREVCDPLGLDEDCDLCTVGEVTATGRGGDSDRDQDGFASRACFNVIATGAPLPVCSTPTLDDAGDASATAASIRVTSTRVEGTDCEDDPAAGGGTRNPAARESCNLVDDDCDGIVDNDLGLICYEDRDLDGYAAMGAARLMMAQCSICPRGYTARAPVERDVDCNDTIGGAVDGARVYPRARDVCNAIDDDCDPSTLDGADDMSIGLVCTTMSVDGGVGRCQSGRYICGATGLTCATSTAVNEMCNAIDDDCDGMTDETFCVDSTIDALGRQTAESGFGACVAGNRCAIGRCVDGRASCDGDATNGCEVDTRTNSDHCGACGARCNGQPCVNGVCAGAPSIRSVATGAAHVCVALADGSVQCWGANSLGQLGDGTATDRALPAPVADLSSVVELSAGAAHTCARSMDGSVRCWGDNGRGQIGASGVGGTRRTPTNVLDVTDAVELTSGPQHTCVRRATGAVLCWGANDSGELGRSTVGGSYGRPDPVVGLTNVAEISAGGVSGSGVYRAHTCARLADNTMRCWGNNARRQLGDRTSIDRASPVAPAEVRDPVVEIAAGGEHTCVRRMDGAVFCWGANDQGQTSDAPAPARPATRVVGVGAGATALEASGDSSSALLGNRLFYWGTNSDLQLTRSVQPRTFLEIATELTAVGPVDLVRIGSGTFRSATATNPEGGFVCARQTSGALRCWGANDRGQLGDGTTVARMLPTTALVSTPSAQVVAGAEFTCVRRAAGSVVCVGDNRSGQAGNGMVGRADTPVEVVGLSNAVDLAAGYRHACAVLSTGAVRCWGENRVGQLGDGTTITPRLALVTAQGITNATRVAVSDQFSCARSADGTVRCWGDNRDGIIGNGTAGMVPALTPQLVSSVTNAVSITVGLRHVCALLATGSVRCWGNNDEGQLGDGTLVARSTPTLVTGLSDAVEIAAGEHFTCARRVSGSVVCWGRNIEGQLGDGTRTSRLVPTAVLSLSDAVELSLGAGSACVRRASGSVVCWGRDSVGQLGDGAIGPDTTAPNLSSPVSGITDALQITVGIDHACARRASGQVVCWGNASTARLGPAAMNPTASPVPFIGQ